MKKAKPAVKVKKTLKSKKVREYDNAGRSRKSNLTRQKIIELYVNLLVEANGQDVPLQVLAKKSKTSMRTLFRFFGDKESLNQEIDNYLGQYFVSVSDNLLKMSFAEYAAHSYRVFDEYEKLFKAYLFTNFGQKSRAVFRKKYTEMVMKKLLHELALNPGGAELRRVYFIVSLINANIWKDLKDSFGVSGTDISDTVLWAVGVLVKNLKEPAN